VATEDYQRVLRVRRLLTRADTSAADMLKLPHQINQSENVTHNECKRGSLQ
jgi:hypothetical protein